MTRSKKKIGKKRNPIQGGGWANSIKQREGFLRNRQESKSFLLRRGVTARTKAPCSRRTTATERQAYVQRGKRDGQEGEKNKKRREPPRRKYQAENEGENTPKLGESLFNPGRRSAMGFGMGLNNRRKERGGQERKHGNHHLGWATTKVWMGEVGPETEQDRQSVAAVGKGLDQFVGKVHCTRKPPRKSQKRHLQGKRGGDPPDRSASRAAAP